ncbi:hypothetical protein ACLOJK_023127 [Asimina triloba]
MLEEESLLLDVCDADSGMQPHVVCYLLPYPMLSAGRVVRKKGVTCRVHVHVVLFVGPVEMGTHLLLG